MSTVRLFLRETESFKDEVLVTNLGGVDQNDWGLLRDENVEILKIGVNLIPNGPANTDECAVVIQAVFDDSGGGSVPAAQYVDLLIVGKPALQSGATDTYFRNAIGQGFGNNGLENLGVAGVREFNPGFGLGRGWEYRISLWTGVAYIGQTGRFWTYIRTMKA